MNGKQFLICAIIDNSNLKNGITIDEIRNKLIIPEKELRKIIYDLKREEYLKYRFKRGAYKYTSYCTTVKFFKYLKSLQVGVRKDSTS